MDLKLAVWDKLKRPPLDALKTIGAGRLKGKSDINPQWRYKAMTEQFGICGIGWKFAVEDKWIDDGANGEKTANVLVNLYIKQDGEWSDAIPGLGGSMFIANESKGPFTSDEAYKMATTDALGTAMKMIGVAADIYLGSFDGSKYKQEPASEDDEKVATAAMVQACLNDLVRLADIRKVEPNDVLREITGGKLANCDDLFTQKQKTVRAIINITKTKEA